MPDDNDKQQNDQPQKKWPDKAPEQPAGDKIIKRDEPREPGDFNEEG